MCNPKGCGFLAIVVRNMASVLVLLLPHTSRFFVVHVVELQIFCWGQIALKFVGARGYLNQ